jgi:hypothetical protein
VNEEEIQVYKMDVFSEILRNHILIGDYSLPEYTKKGKVKKPEP